MGDPAYTILIVGTSEAQASELRQRFGPEARVEFATPEHADAKADKLRSTGVTVAILHSGERYADSREPEFSEMDRAYALLDAVNEGVCLLGADGSIVWANAFFRTLDPAVGERVRAAARDSLAWLVEQRERRGRCTTRNVEIGDDDSDSWYEVVISLAHGEGAGVADTRLVAVIRDVSEARRIERKMTAIEQAGRDLVSIDPEFVRSKNAMERLSVLESRIIETAHKLLNFDHFAIRLVNEKSGKLELVISEGLSPMAAELDLYPSRTGNGIAGFVASTGVSEVSNDAAHDARFLPCLQGASSAMVVPLRLHDRVIGVLDVESLKPGAFNEEDRRFAEHFARHLAMALRVLDLLVVERCETNATVSGRMQGELREPLDDIAEIVEQMRGATDADPNLAARLARIAGDVDSIRDRMRRVAEGPRALLGVERAMSSTETEPLIQGRRVLVADDEPAVRRVIADVLRNRGATVDVCDNGAAAIDAVRASSEAGLGFDLVISDIKMPDRNGYEVFSAARRTLPDVPVILMTGFGYDPSHSIVRASQEGLQCVLFKPFQVERLLEEIRSAFEKKDQKQAESRAEADSKDQPNHQTV
jgi:CheY-like chemotaxis protein/putative methionine-R-sulfoxide reductase with GAF domain/PAS domain-containing protein